MFCHICLQDIHLSKTREHVRSHCFDGCSKEDYLRVYRKVVGVVTITGNFQMDSEKLKEVGKKGSELLENATSEDLDDWTEW